MKRPLTIDQSWKVLLAGNVFFVVLGVGGAILLTEANMWVRLLDAFIGGFNVATAFSVIMLRRMQRSFDDVRKAFDAMAELNTALISGKVDFMIVREQDDDAPTAPTRLH